MRREINLALAGRLIFLAVFAVLSGYILFNVREAGAERARAAERQTGAIMTALAQCYALEGSYPADIKYLSRYGVIFDDSRFYYYYETNGLGNYMPDVRAVAK